MATTRILVERLEQMLNLWEDFHFFLEVCKSLVAQGADLTPKYYAGAIEYAESLRGALLRIVSGRESIETIRGRYVKAGLIEGYPELAILPIGLIFWTVYSRRVFHVSNDVQLLLNTTSLERVRWGDVSRPFPAFFISLAIPLTDKRGIKFDSMLVGFMKDGPSGTPYTLFFLLSDQLESYKPLAYFTKQEIRADLRRRRQASAKKFAEEFALRGLTDVAESRYFEAFQVYIRDEDELITSSIGKMVDGYEVLFAEARVNDFPVPDLNIIRDMAARIGIGLCLYLDTVPPASSLRRSTWQQPRNRNKLDGRAITNGADVCTVLSVQSLTREEGRILGKTLDTQTAREVCAHFRRGHWRRPPGQGEDPTAPRVVHVRPTLVRRDRLQDGMLPGGNMTKLQ